MSEEITPYQVVPKTPLAGSAAAEIRDQGEITRRSFPWVLTIAWSTLAAALGGLATTPGPFLFPHPPLGAGQKIQGRPARRLFGRRSRRALEGQVRHLDRPDGREHVRPHHRLHAPRMHAELAPVSE